MYNERSHKLCLNKCALNISPSLFNALVVRMKSKVVNAAACSIPVEKFGVPKTMYKIKAFCLEKSLKIDQSGFTFIPCSRVV